MVINFAKIDLRKRPNFIVRNFDGTAIGVLGNILRPTAQIRYNEVSEIEFEYPKYVHRVYYTKKYNLIIIFYKF